MKGPQEEFIEAVVQRIRDGPHGPYAEATSPLLPENAWITFSLSTSVWWESDRPTGGDHVILGRIRQRSNLMRAEYARFWLLTDEIGEDRRVEGVTQKVFSVYAWAISNDIPRHYNGFTFTLSPRYWQENRLPQGGDHLVTRASCIRKHAGGLRSIQTRFWNFSQDGRKVLSKANQVMSKQTVLSKQERTKVMSNEQKTGQADLNGAAITLEKCDYQVELFPTTAKVVVTQEHLNKATVPIEAIFGFMLDDEAAVTDCVIEIGHRTVTCDIQKKAQARKQYDDAVASGQQANLMEQERPNIFTMNTGGIKPGQRIKVKVTYVQKVPWQGNQGRFVIKTTLPPIFAPSGSAGLASQGYSDPEKIQPLIAPQGVPYHTDITINFKPGFRSEVTIPSHSKLFNKQTVKKNEEKEFKTGPIIPDRDFVFNFRPLSATPETTVHGCRFQDESYVITSITPPSDVEAKGSDILFVLDLSGSMAIHKGAPKFKGLKVITKLITERLQKQAKSLGLKHRVGYLPFCTEPHKPLELSEIGDEHYEYIEAMEIGNWTYLGKAMKAAKKLFDKESDRPKVIIVVCDGQSDDNVYFQDHGIRVVCVGIDAAIDDNKIKELSINNHGTYEYVAPGENYDGLANRFLGYLTGGPVLRQVEVETSGDAVGVSDAYPGRPATIAIRFDGEPSLFTIRGINPQGQEVVWKIDPLDADGCPFADKLWVRDKFREISDNAAEQIRLSLKHHMLCRHTSFIGVSVSEVPCDAPVTMKIPVEPPKGWEWDWGATYDQQPQVVNDPVRTRAAVHRGGDDNHMMGLTSRSRRNRGGTRRIIGSASGSQRNRLLSLGSDDDSDDRESMLIEEMHHKSVNEGFGEETVRSCCDDFDDNEVLGLDSTDEDSHLDEDMEDVGDFEELVSSSVDEIELVDDDDDAEECLDSPTRGFDDDDDEDLDLCDEDELGIASAIEDFEDPEWHKESGRDRFNINAQHPVNILVGALIAASTDALEDAVNAVKRFNKIHVPRMKKLNPEDRAMAFYFAMRLADYSDCGIREGLLAVLEEKPASTEERALVWHALAQRERGQSVPMPQVLEGMDGRLYILWKTARGPQPSREPWTLVP